jgi:DNA (cytosine-5)-methyltransferase 1
MAMNHWKLAVETHNTNFPDTDHDTCDISAADPRRYPSTDILITSPECTTHSPAGGNRRSTPQSDLFLPRIDDAATQRSRATMRDVPRFTEYHQYRRIIVENVVEVTRWPLFHHWLKEMEILGYRWQLVSLNSMHCWPTPQSRDRLYICFWRKGDPSPDMRITPKAPCHRCERVVDGVQTWKAGALKRAIAGQPLGKYRTQYVYSCPVCRSEVTPFYYAALNAIDFSLAAERIGDRSAGRQLKARTIERIRYGLEKYGNRQLIIRTNMTSGLETRVRGLEEPHFTQTASWLDGMFSPFLVNAQHSDGGPLARSIDDPLATVAASNRPSLVSPFFVETAYSHSDSRRVPTQETREKFAVALVDPAFLATLRTNSRANALDDPLSTLTAGGGHHMLIHGAAQLSMRNADAMRVAGLDEELRTQGAAPQAALLSPSPFLTSYYGNNQAAGIDDAIDTVTVRDRHGLVSPAKELRVEDCYFRMLQPHEIGRAMAFPTSYEVLGNKRDRVKQYGNAVTPPAMATLIERQVQAMTGDRAA